MDALHACEVLVSSPHYVEASRRVMRQLLEALVFEQQLPVTWPRPGRLQIEVPGGKTLYTCAATREVAFDRVRVLGPIERSCARKQDEALDPALFLAEVAPLMDVDAAAVQCFAAELLATQLKHAQTLQARGGEVLRHADYDTVEARLSHGHPYHPGFKSRMGFDLADNAQFSPELARPFSPWLLAARRDRCVWSASATLDPKDLWRQLLGPEDAAQYQAVLEQRGLATDDYLPLPVHPWQWREVIALQFHPALARAVLVPIGRMAARYRPQQSIRTLANLDNPLGWTLKLSMSLVNTSTARVLAPHTVANAAPISDWLQRRVADTDWPAPLASPTLLHERAGVSYQSEHPGIAPYGALACLWRESVPRRRPGARRALPMSALCHIDGDGRPLIAPWLQQYGAEAWLRQLLDRAFLPVLHLLWSQGIALESHAQNMVLLHARGWPTGVMLKDFHDGVRFSRRWLTAPPPPLQPPPPEHARINPNSFLECDVADELRDFTLDALCFVNLAELAWCWTRDHGLDPQRFWQIARLAVTEHQLRHRELAPAFARFDVGAPTLAIEPLAARRLHPHGDLPYRQSPNPLAAGVACD